MADCCLIKKVATVEVYENKNEVRAYGFMAGDRNTPVMEVRFKHLWGESNLSTCKLRWIIVDDVGSLLVGEVPIQSDNTALINLPNELFTGDRRMKVQLTVASCDGERILNLQQFTDLKVINSLAPNEVVEPVYQILINQLYDETQKYLSQLDTLYTSQYGSLENLYVGARASLEQYLITAENGGNAEFLQGYSPAHFQKVENTINDLIASTKYSVGDVVEVLGYYEKGDGAHHKRIISATDDGSGVLLANGLYANIIHNGEVNVSWFGAKGDGVTDDTNSIQKTLDFCKNNNCIASSKNNTNHLITSTINMYSSSGFNGRGCIFKRSDNFIGENTIIANGSDFIVGRKIENFRVVGLIKDYPNNYILTDSINQAWGTLCNEGVIGIYVSGQFVNIEKVYVENCYKGIVFGNSNTYLNEVKDSTVRACYIGYVADITNGGNAGENIRITNGSIANCVEAISVKAMNLSFLGTSIDYNLFFTKNSTTSIGAVSSCNLLFTNCWIEHIKREGEIDVETYFNSSDAQVFFVNCEIIYNKGTFIKNIGSVAKTSFNACNFLVYNTSSSSYFSQCTNLATYGNSGFTNYGNFIFKNKDTNLIYGGDLKTESKTFKGESGSVLTYSEGNLNIKGGTYTSAEVSIHLKSNGTDTPVILLDLDSAVDVRVYAILNGETINTSMGTINDGKTILYQLRKMIVHDYIILNIKKPGINNELNIKGVFAYEF